MLRNLSTKRKLFLLPITFIIIVIVSAFVYSHFNSVAEGRINVASQTDTLIQQLLKGRISVYQFLRTPSEQTAQNVRADFKKFDEFLNKLKPQLQEKENIDLANNILDLSKEYINSFDKFYSKKIDEYNNNILKEGSQTLAIIKEMVDVGLKLEEKL